MMLLCGGLNNTVVVAGRTACAAAVFCRSQQQFLSTESGISPLTGSFQKRFAHFEGGDNEVKDSSGKELAKTEGPTTISTISQGFTDYLFTSSTTQAQFQMVSNGLGSIVHIFCPPNSYAKVRPDSLLAHSSTLKVSSSMFGNPVKALVNKIGGGSFSVVTVSSSKEQGDCLVSPTKVGDVAILSLDGHTGYVIGNENFLASTANVSLGLSYLSEISPSLAKAYSNCHGTGSLAITAPGGLFRLVLEEGEKYEASTKHLVAWEASMDPRVHSNELTVSRFKFITHVLNWIKTKISPKSKAMCELHGPGEFYLTSRLDQGKTYQFSFLRQEREQEPQVITVTDTPSYAAPAEQVKNLKFEPDDESVSGTKEKIPSGASDTIEIPEYKQQTSSTNNMDGKGKKPWYKFW
eukprot:m.142727 g.142727  ORF g.142727 m.142727 type:complete len:407 (-) comp13197_c1_seq6:3052-4272(-)